MTRPRDFWPLGIVREPQTVQRCRVYDGAGEPVRRWQIAPAPRRVCLGCGAHDVTLVTARGRIGWYCGTCWR